MPDTRAPSGEALPAPPVIDDPTLPAHEREANRILYLKAEIERNFWELGCSLTRVKDEEYWKDSGYRSFNQYLGQKVKISHSFAYELIDIVKYFTKELAAQHGQTKLTAAVIYAKATPQDEHPREVLEYDSILIPTRSGQMRKKSFVESTAWEIKRAAAGIRKKKSGGAASPTKRMPGPVIPGGPRPYKRASLELFLEKARASVQGLESGARLDLDLPPGEGMPRLNLHLVDVPANRLVEALRLVTGIAEATLGM